MAFSRGEGREGCGSERPRGEDGHFICQMYIPNVRYWHLADIAEPPINVRYEVKRTSQTDAVMSAYDLKRTSTDVTRNPFQYASLSR